MPIGPFSRLRHSANASVRPGWRAAPDQGLTSESYWAGASFSKLYVKKIQIRLFFRQANPKIPSSVLSIFKGLQASCSESYCSKPLPPTLARNSFGREDQAGGKCSLSRFRKIQNENRLHVAMSVGAAPNWGEGRA